MSTGEEQSGKMDKTRLCWGLFLLGVLVLVLLDQLTKLWAARVLKGTGGIPLIPGVFELYYLYPENRGIAFGMFQGGTVVFAVFSIILIIGILILFARMPKTKRFLPAGIVFALLLSGALGNLIDRCVRGYVIDFLYFSLIHFPVFNLADTYVVCGGILLVLFGLFLYKDDEDLAWVIPSEKRDKAAADGKSESDGSGNDTDQGGKET